MTKPTDAIKVGFKGSNIVICIGLSSDHETMIQTALWRGDGKSFYVSIPLEKRKIDNKLNRRAILETLKNTIIEKYGYFKKSKNVDVPSPDCEVL